MEKESIKKGDLIHSNDDTIIQVHHIGEYGEVYYLAYADNARGQIGSEPFDRHYGYIGECHEVTEAETEWFNFWLDCQLKSKENDKDSI
jgi:hypothetical protein